MSDHTRPFAADSAFARLRGVLTPRPVKVHVLRRMVPSVQGATGVVLAVVAALVAPSTVFGASHDPANAAAHPAGALRAGPAGVVLHSTVASTGVVTSA